MPQKDLKKIVYIFVVSFVLMLFLGSFAFAQNYQDQRKELAVHYYRGAINFEAGRYNQAFDEFHLVSKTDPAYKDTRNYLLQCIKILDSSREKKNSSVSSKDSTDLYFLGKSYYENGDYRRAFEAFKAVLRRTPNDKFAQYYFQMCTIATANEDKPKLKQSREEELVSTVGELEKETAYVKANLKEEADEDAFLKDKADRKAAREELIRKKEKQLKNQEELLDEERADYLAQAQISKKGEKLKKEAEKWKHMKERLASEQPGVPANLTEYPTYRNKADDYYVAMKDALRQSRWNSAGLNAISASIHYCDAMLIYFYGVKSAAPAHDNINRLIIQHVKRSDVDENIFHMRSILNLKKLIEDDDRPITRSESLFLAQHTDKLAEWCKSMFP